MSIDNPNIGNYTAISVIDRVKDQSACRCIWITHWCWNLRHDLIEQIGNTIACFSGNTKTILWLASNEVCKFCSEFIWLSIRYGIDVYLMVGTPKIEGGKLKIDLPEYNEKKALAKLKVIFG